MLSAAASETPQLTSLGVAIRVSGLSAKTAVKGWQIRDSPSLPMAARVSIASIDQPTIGQQLNRAKAQENHARFPNCIGLHLAAARWLDHFAQVLSSIRAPATNRSPFPGIISLRSVLAS
jgi:hypothetical protein